MAVRFRRQLQLFPGVRLNVSKSGLSVSLGPRGASVTVGPRGTYANIGAPATGLYLRERLRPGAGASGEPVPEPDAATPPPTPQRSRTPLVPTPRPPPLDTVEAMGAEVRSGLTGTLTTAGLIPLRQLLHDAAAQWAEASVVGPRLDRQLDATEARLARLERSWFRFLRKKGIAAAKAGIAELRQDIAAVRERLSASVVPLDFGLEGDRLQAWLTFIDAFGHLSRCERVWDVTTQRDVDKVKARSTAGVEVTRTPVALRPGECRVIHSEVKGLRFGNANGDDVFLYPCFAVIWGKSGHFDLLDLRELTVKAEGVRFREHERLPSDARVVEQDWLKANKDGSPDRRFKDNRQIPVCHYAYLWLRTGSGLREAYMVSNPLTATRFEEAYAAYVPTVAPFTAPPGSFA